MGEVFQEPPDGAHVLVGRQPTQVLLIRDDGEAAAAREAWQDLPEDARWWPVHDDAVCVRWADVIGADRAVPDGLPATLDRSRVVRMHSQDEADRLVAEARREAGLMLVGDHLIEPGGYCRTHGSHHSPEEIARAEERAAAEEPVPVPELDGDGGGGHV